MEIAFFLIAIVIVFSIIGSINKSRKNKRLLKEALKKIEDAFNKQEIAEQHKDYLIKKVNSNNLAYFRVDDEIQSMKELILKDKMLRNKYGNDIASKLLNHEYWVGMTKEQLLDCKGKPTKIETAALKTKTKETFIYGNKSSGDYFVLEND